MTFSQDFSHHQITRGNWNREKRKKTGKREKKERKLAGVMEDHSPLILPIAAEKSFDGFLFSRIGGGGEKEKEKRREKMATWSNFLFVCMFVCLFVCLFVWEVKGCRGSWASTVWGTRRGQEGQEERKKQDKETEKRNRKRNRKGVRRVSLLPGGGPCQQMEAWLGGSGEDEVLG